MPFSINEFRAEINTTNASHQAHFEIEVLPPPGLRGEFNSFINLNSDSRMSVDQARRLTMRIDASEIPGRGVQTADTRYWGPQRRIAYNPTHTDVSLSVICSDDLREREFFDTWQDAVVGQYRSDGQRSGPENQFNLNYYDHYASTVAIRQFDVTGKLTYVIELVEAYPVFVSPLSLAWSSDEIHRLNVTMAYRYYKSENRPNERTQPFQPRARNTVADLFNLGRKFAPAIKNVLR